MARLSILSEDVRSFVDTSLAPLFLAEISTARLCKLLNANLSRAGLEGTIHPNRVHALLSDDVSRGVNEATFNIIQQAVEAYATENVGWHDRFTQRLSEVRAEAAHLGQHLSLPDEEITKRLALPPAVGRLVLSEGTAENTAQKPIPIVAPSRRKPPEWSFQDVAIARCLEAFRQRTASKIGLILPTGAGKTRTALRVVLQILARHEGGEGTVYWVTHRKNLRTQAHRELQKLLSAGGDQVPPDAATLLAKRIRFVMVSELPTILAPDAVPPLLIVVDEAHHAAAPSYQPIFNTAHTVPCLFLTATPNRTDSLPIGIDEVAYTTTYRELEERGVVIMPEFHDFPVKDFEWEPEQVKDLADYVIDEAAGRFTKTLVLAPRIDRVEEFYDELLEALSNETGHPLDPDDIGYVHGTGNSLHIDNDSFLDLFAEKPRAILVSAQLLIEGFDDPAINAVVLTYPSESVAKLMQAAGRCVRFAENKLASHVVQARNDKLAYHFDQRWLYQEISDYLRPRLDDIYYASESDLAAKLSRVLAEHRVKPADQGRILDRVANVRPGELCRVLLYGYPFYGAGDEFESQSTWGAFLETADNSRALRGIFNGFCDLGAGLSDPSEFLAREGPRYGVIKNLSTGSVWRDLVQILTSSYFAREEIYGADPLAKAFRPSKRHGPTSWLRYLTFHFQPDLPDELSAFFGDCYNKNKLIAAYLDEPTHYVLAVKIPLPLSGFEGWLLSADTAHALQTCIDTLRAALQEVEPAAQFGTVAGFLTNANYPALPSRLLLQIGALLNATAFSERTLPLNSYQLSQTSGE